MEIFYRYLDDILHVALNLPYTDRFEIVGNFPGVRARLDLDHRELVENPTDSCSGGTGLYRHRPTGLERVPPLPDETIRQLANQLELRDEFSTSPEGYENSQNSIIFNPLFACRDNRYINDGNEYWELLKLIEMRPNRLIMFDGRCFHSQYIQSGHYNQAFRVNQTLYLSQKKQLS